MRLQILVQDAELPDHAAAVIGEQRVIDTVLLRERLQTGLRVIRDPQDRIAGALELPMDALQLDQLHLAVGSPDRTAVEGDDRATPGAIRVKIDFLAALIRQANVRKDLSDLWTSRSVVDVCAHVTANLRLADG